jgi:hypothetical protein
MKMDAKPNLVCQSIIGDEFSSDERDWPTHHWAVLQDVVPLEILVGSLAGCFVAVPYTCPRLSWRSDCQSLFHVGNMAAYLVLDSAVSPIISPSVVDDIGNPREVPMATTNRR